MYLPSSLPIALPPEVTDAIVTFAGAAGFGPLAALGFFALIAVAVITAIACAPADKRSEAALNVLAMLTRAKRPPDAGS